MTNENIIRFFDTYKKGTYTKVVKATEKNGFVKITKMVCRFVNYYNIKSVKEKAPTPKAPREYEEVLIPHVLKINHNTNNTLLNVYITNHHKAHTEYYYKGVAISEDDYYMGIGEKKRDYAPTPLFSFKANEVVSLGAY